MILFIISLFATAETTVIYEVEFDPIYVIIGNLPTKDKKDTRPISCFVDCYSLEKDNHGRPLKIEK